MNIQIADRSISQREMRYSCNETHGKYSIIESRISELGIPPSGELICVVKDVGHLCASLSIIPTTSYPLKVVTHFMRYPAPCYERRLTRYSSLLNQSGSWRSILISRTVCTGAYAARYHSPFQFSTFISVASCTYELPLCGTRLWLWIMGNIHGRFISSRIRLHYSWSFTFPVRGWGCYAPQGKNIFTQSVSIR